MQCGEIALLQGYKCLNIVKVPGNVVRGKRCLINFLADAIDGRPDESVLLYIWMPG